MRAGAGGGPVGGRPRYFQVLAEALEQLTAADTRAAILNVMRNYARRLVEADGVAVVLREGGECFYSQVDAPPGALWEGQRFPLMSCISGWAMLRQETAVVEDVYRDARIPHAVYHPTFVNSLVMVPVGRGAAGAAIGAYWKLAHRPGDDAVALLETLARAAGGALERCAAEEAVRAGERRLCSVFSNTPVGFAVAGAGGWLVETNARFAAMLGYAPQELAGRPLLALSHPGDAPALERLLARLAAGGLAHVDHEQRYLHRSGADVWVSSACWRIEQAQGGPGTIAMALLDITRQKDAEAQLSWAQRMDALGRITCGIARDFNNLLTVVNGGAEMLAEAVADMPAARQLAATVQAAGEKGAVLTGRLLSFAQREETNPQPLQPDAVLAGMRPMLRATLRDAIALDLVLACTGVQVVADPSAFESAILNLVLNARDAMPDGGTLTIATSLVAAGPHAAEHLMIVVRDTGIGMTPDVCARAFEPFFTTRATGAGKGLGLSMVYGFARRAQGMASLHSRAGAGTEVRLCLPTRAGAAADDPRRHGAYPMGAGERILVVDGDSLVRDYLVQALGALGYRAQAVACGAAALELLAAGAGFDVLMGDQALLGDPGADLSAGAALRLRPELKILLAASPEAQRAGADGLSAPPLLYKPFGWGELAAALAHVLGRSG